MVVVVLLVVMIIVIVMQVVVCVVVTADPRELILYQIQFLIFILNLLFSFSVRASSTLLVYLILSTGYLSIALINS